RFPRRWFVSVDLCRTCQYAHAERECRPRISYSDISRTQRAQKSKLCAPVGGLAFHDLAPQIDHHLAVDVDGERGAEVFPRLELGGEQLAQGVEAGAARAAQRRRVIAHEASVQQAQLKLTPMWHGQL